MPGIRWRLKLITKLRIKFFTSAMLSLIIVLSVIVGGVNILNYRGVVEDADNILKILQENQVRFPGNSQT